MSGKQRTHIATFIDQSRFGYEMWVDRWDDGRMGEGGIYEKAWQVLLLIVEVNRVWWFGAVLRLMQNKFCVNFRQR
jgi:hypothetical protein